MKMSQRTKKILNIVVDIFVFLILALALIFAISIITSRASGYEGYTVIFGKTYLAVESDSMAKEYGTENTTNAQSFSRGDLLVIDTIEQDEVSSLEAGTVITFKTNQLTQDETAYILNTHRIVEVHDGYFTTKGDNNATADNYRVYFDDVIGVYDGEKIEGLGNFVLFMGSFGGFCTFVLVPSILVVIYFAVNLVLVILKEKKKQTAEAAEENQKLLEEQKEKMRQEILAELAKEKEANAGAQSPEEEHSDGEE